MEKEKVDIVKIREEVSTSLANKDAMQTLVATTFKNIPQALMPQAITEGMMRGFTFRDFLEKNIYAIGYGNTYSLVTSIDYARKVGMRSGVVGKSAPAYVEDNRKIVSCEITIKKKVGGEIGDFTATVYFDEYTTGKNLWTTKPRTMIAKVAEMHALRMACPEELSQAYVEEEVERGERVVAAVTIDKTEYIKILNAAKTAKELKTAWTSFPPAIILDMEMVGIKETLKKKFTPKKDEKAGI